MSTALPIPKHAKKVFEGTIFDVYQWDQEMYDGSTHVFERLKRPDTVYVIPVTEAGTILLLNEQQPDRIPYVSFPGGRMEEGEDPQGAAARELLEETGYAAEELVPLMAIKPVVKMEWTVYVYAGRGCRKVGQPNVDPGEKISVTEISFQEMLGMAVSGELPDGSFTHELLRAQLDPAKMARLTEQLGIRI